MPHPISTSMSQSPKKMPSDSVVTTAPPPSFSFYLDWAIRLLSLIAALLFGIWAPLAYTATIVANRDADLFQTTLSQRLDEVTAMQRTVHERLHELEMLKVWELCAGPGMDVVACKALMNGEGNQTVERLGRIIGNAFDAPMPTTTPTGAVTSTSDGGVISRVPSSSSEGMVSRTLTSTATTIPTTPAHPTSSMPAIIGAPDSPRDTNLRGLGAAAGVIGFVALLAAMCMRSRSSAYRAYHRV